jgi:hypothetical protein
LALWALVGRWDEVTRCGGGTSCCRRCVRPASGLSRRPLNLERRRQFSIIVDGPGLPVVVVVVVVSTRELVHHTTTTAIGSSSISTT